MDPRQIAQIDHLICRQRWRNSIKNVESRTDIAVDSDHAMIIARVKIKLKNDKTLRRHTINRSREPTEALKTQFNDRIREIYSFISGSKGIEVNNTRFTHAISKATKECLIKIPFEQKTSYISEETWQLIQRRQEARNNGQTQVEKHLTLCVKRQAKLDKKKWRLDRLEDWKTPKSKWAGIKFEKKVFTPSFYKMKDIHGRPVPLDKKADALAEYLEKTSLGPDHRPTGRTNRQNTDPSTPPSHRSRFNYRRNGY